MERYQHKHLDDKRAAAQAAIDRLRNVLASANVSGLDYPAFRLLCQLANGIWFTSKISSRRQILGLMPGREADLDQSIEVMGTRKFRDDTPKNRDQVLKGIEAERVELHALYATASGFDELQCTAILEAIEDFKASEDHFVIGTEAVCKRVYDELQARSAASLNG